MLPTINCYCQGTTPSNAMRVDWPTGLTVWFSYQTPVAFVQGWPADPVVRVNDWGPTTGKHLNAIDDGRKHARIPGDKFEELLECATRWPERFARYIEMARAIGKGVEAIEKDLWQLTDTEVE